MRCLVNLISIFADEFTKTYPYNYCEQYLNGWLFDFNPIIIIGPRYCLGFGAAQSSYLHYITHTIFLVIPFPSSSIMASF